MTHFKIVYKLFIHYFTVQKFNRGHPRFFDQSEADSLTKNFDFVVFKANQIQS